MDNRTQTKPRLSPRITRVRRMWRLDWRTRKRSTWKLQQASRQDRARHRNSRVLSRLVRRVRAFKMSSSASELWKVARNEYAGTRIGAPCASENSRIRRSWSDMRLLQGIPNESGSQGRTAWDGGTPGNSRCMAGDYIKNIISIIKLMFFCENAR